MNQMLYMEVRDPRVPFNIEGEEETIDSDDEYLYRHDIYRLYLAIQYAYQTKSKFYVQWQQPLRVE